MSTALSSASAPARPIRPAGRERLRAVDASAPRRRPRLVYGIVAVAGAVAIAGAQMAMSILTTQSSYELSTLTQQQRELTWQKQILYDEVAGLSSPQYLAANATALGMVIDESPSYLRLSDGAILGAGQASFGASSVDALGRASVANDLIASTPLVTDPGASLATPTPVPTETAPADGATAVDGTAGTDGAAGTEADVTTPPPLTDGLPTPSTH